MSTFTNISTKITRNSIFRTPSGKRSFIWMRSDETHAYLQVGDKKTTITIPSECFNELPEFLKGKDWVRIGATHGNPPEGSVDELLQHYTGGLSVASYVIPILVEYNVVEISSTRPMKVRYANQDAWRRARAPPRTLC